MATHWTESQLQRLADCAWGEITKFCNPDACVLATRVFIEALGLLGDRRADGLVMQAIVMSPEAAAHYDEHSKCAIGVCEGRGDRPIAMLGWDPDAPGRGLKDSWPGHLVAVVQKRWIVDLTLSQISRPELNLVVEGTLVLDAPAKLLRGQAFAELAGENGIRVLYRAMPKASPEWRSSADWAWPTPFRHELVLGTLASYSGREPKYSGRTRRIHALVGKV